MKRLRILLLIFCLSLSVPLAYFVRHTYRSLDQEETAQLRYFAETLFDEMERELAVMVRKEENRAIDEYNFYYAPDGHEAATTRSPLSWPPHQAYILGYLQNNPDGSFQTPLRNTEKGDSEERPAVAAQLEAVNRIFNRKRTLSPEVYEIQPLTPVPVKQKTEKKEPGFADRFLSLKRTKEQSSYLGQAEKRTERITSEQVANLDRTAQKAGREQMKVRDAGKRPPLMEKPASEESAPMATPDTDEGATDEMAAAIRQEPALFATAFQAEVGPMQSVFIDADRIFIFRRIAVRNRIFRQGFVISGEAFLNHLARTHFTDQPMSGFTRLELTIVSQGRKSTSIHFGQSGDPPRFSSDRRFPRPFSFLRATLNCAKPPESPGRQTLNMMVAVLAGVMLAGMFAIYRSARAVTELSDRRSRFVSSVTHELKTPLTNIRMYIEMLEQGIARTPEREQEYFRILGAESARLSRLISNILEFSKLEKKQLRLNMQAGTFEEVFPAVRDIIGHSLQKQGFALKTGPETLPAFVYDREMMIQVMVNLIENSMKFGKSGEKKEITVRPEADDKQVCIRVSDTGPGIPRHALKKVFDDFYRVENALIRNTGGTGIGLAFVRKVVGAMGGRVTAANNDGPGCTITVSLPRRARQQRSVFSRGREKI
ncbi:hypothetical protein DENIS_0932 [Desulfonema ishimotonii]|uniref:histidine kinase n=1 Tax=Desulfonema ishimotonii TaxID=45657 RepID=A0A401FSR9_9BACT|nr:HAMP domain-containing sensor histidine kinase [Desulfonema ishimotonii]GBC59990.1 hypothetical protein DENIS_0932 [Desulfonema ishimotonii]